MIITLTGFMGCGKSTVGRTLQRLMPGFGLSDLDCCIEKMSGRSIPEIFSREGEAGFRDIEYKCLQEVIASGGPLILPLGGGTVTDERSRGLVRNRTDCFYMKASPATIREHLLKKSTLEEAAQKRPMLAGNDMEKLMEKRGPLYEAAAAHTILTDGKSAVQIANEIMSYL